MSTSTITAHPAQAVSSRRHPLWLWAKALSPSRVLALLLLLGAALRLWMLAHGVPTLDSDEATFGLMALHVPSGDWSAFMWGQPYMGSLEAFYIAPFVALLGPSTLALRLGPMLLSLLFIATASLMASRLYSRPVALATAVLLAVGSPFYLVLSERAYGGYVETLVFGNVLLLLALFGGSTRAGSARALALIGLIAGLALWTDLLIAPYIAVACLVLWWQRRVRWRSRDSLILVGTLLVGATPALYYNVMHGAPTLGSVLSLTVAGSHGAHAAPSLLAVLPHNIWLELTVSLPILLGGFLGGTQGTGLTPSDYLRQAADHPAAYAVALALTACAVALFCGAAYRILRELRHAPLRAAKSGRCEAALIHRQGEAALALLAACYTAAFALSSHAETFSSPRYLLPLFAVTPVLVAQGERALHWLATRRFASLPARSHLRLGLGIVLLICAWNLTGDIALTPLQTAARDHGIWIAGSDEMLLRVLAADHVHTVISNDYWEGLRLTYESGEHVVTVMMPTPGHLGFNRYQPYVTTGLADPRPAYLELTGTPEATRDMARFTDGAFPGYTRMRLGLYAVLLPPP